MTTVVLAALVIAGVALALTFALARYEKNYHRRRYTGGGKPPKAPPRSGPPRSGPPRSGPRRGGD